MARRKSDKGIKDIIIKMISVWTSGSEEYIRAKMNVAKYLNVYLDPDKHTLGYNGMEIHVMPMDIKENSLIPYKAMYDKSIYFFYDVDDPNTLLGWITLSEIERTDTVGRKVYYVVSHKDINSPRELLELF